MVKNKQYSPKWIIWGMIALEFDAPLLTLLFFFRQESVAELLKAILFCFFNWSLYADAPYSTDALRN